MFRLTWFQCGEIVEYRPRNCYSFDDAFLLWFEACECDFLGSCVDNRLYLGARLVARQATYLGV